ncbi:MAG: MFS transporter, partial [Acidobacteriota bacterium]|nr:MFS transporter [Acidobacteriota bacterium]
MKEGRKKALLLIVLFGVVSLFSDMVYEGARSVNGPYLKTIGVSAAIVGLITGLGEFLGYAVRLLSGFFSDKSRAYWIFTIVGYAMLAFVPMLSLSGLWQIVALLMILERVGKGIRSPAKDTLLSQATKQVGTGFGFGLHEAMDQIGAIVGPLIFTAVLAVSPYGSAADYRRGYAWLWIPFILCLITIVTARVFVPHPEELEASVVRPEKHSDKLSKLFWIYTVFAFFLVIGFSSFSLLAYHFKSTGLVPDAQIPLFYAIAMGVDGATALLAGRLYDKVGLAVLFVIPILTIPIPFLGFSSSYGLAIAGIMLWGVVMGIHETVVKAAIADLTPLKKRGTGYGVFNTINGLAALISGTAIGFLYDRSIPAVIVFCVAVEVV